MPVPKSTYDLYQPAKMISATTKEQQSSLNLADKSSAIPSRLLWDKNELKKEIIEILESNRSNLETKNSKKNMEEPVVMLV